MPRTRIRSTIPTDTVGGGGGVVAGPHGGDLELAINDAFQGIELAVAGETIAGQVETAEVAIDAPDTVAGMVDTVLSELTVTQAETIAAQTDTAATFEAVVADTVAGLTDTALSELTVTQAETIDAQAETASLEVVPATDTIAAPTEAQTYEVQPTDDPLPAITETVLSEITATYAETIAAQAETATYEIGFPVEPMADFIEGATYTSRAWATGSFDNDASRTNPTRINGPNDALRAGITTNLSLGNLTNPVFATSPNFPASVAPVRTRDISGNGRHGAVVGDAVATGGKFGSGVLFDGVDLNDSSLRVVVPSFQIGGSTFCVEAWIKRGRTGVTEVLVGRAGSGGLGLNSYVLYIEADNRVSFVAWNTADTVFVATSAVTITDTTAYHHVVGELVGTTLRVYVDGGAPQTATFTGTFQDSTGVRVGIGGYGEVSLTDPPSPYPFKGIIDDTRISNVSRYAGAAYSVPTAPHATDASTLGLWPLDEITGQPATPDASGNGWTGFVVGRPTLTTQQFYRGFTFAGGDNDDSTQGIFCGYPVIPTTAFTIECFAKENTPTVAGALMAGRWLNGGTPAGLAASQVVLYSDNGRLAVAWVDSLGLLKTIVEVTATLSTRQHIAASFDGSTMRLLRNGAVVGSMALTSVQAQTTSAFWIGRANYDGLPGGSPFPFAGDIDEVRVSSTARYTGAYTVPTERFTTEANTIALWHLDSLVGFVSEAYLRLWFDHAALGTAPTEVIEIRAKSDLVPAGVQVYRATGQIGGGSPISHLGTFTFDLLGAGFTVADLSTLDVTFSYTATVVASPVSTLFVDAAAVEIVGSFA